MRAMVIEKIANLKEISEPLAPVDIPIPRPDPGDVLLRVTACGVCHTELDEIEGRTLPPRLPVVPGHQVIGRVEEMGFGSKRFKVGDRVGVAWIYSACGKCDFCAAGMENLCPDFLATGRDADGGYAQYMKIREDFAYPIPEVFSDMEAAPLLCAGAVGYRAMRLSGIRDNEILGLTGFGASGHLVISMVRHKFPGTRVFVFARSAAERGLAEELGASWMGDIDEEPPDKMNAVIDTTPAWMPDVEAMKRLRPGGRLVINAIRKEDADRDHLLKLDYTTCLWMEKEIKSVANVTRRDVRECLELAGTIPLKAEIQQYRLEDANRALLELKTRKIRGAKVLVMP